VADRILINTGPSPRGWHRIESFLRCPTLYWWKYHRGCGEVSEALVRGSIGHAGLAHFYARLRARQQGQPIDAYYNVPDAMRLVGDTFGDLGRSLVPKVIPVVEQYVNRYATTDVRLRVLGVEDLLETKFHGFRYTARADLVVEDEQGRVWIYDHKFVGRIEDKVFKRYAMCGQFFGLHYLGVARYAERFGGVLVNAVGMDRRVGRTALDAAPWALQRFPNVVANTERQIAAMTDVPIESWPMALSEVVCITPYGPCPHFDACRWGTRS
jgi:hypothetical protein